MMDVTIPGTGGMRPMKDRALACCFVEHQGHAILIDCGEGTQVALQSAGCHIKRLDLLLVTHFHADHISGLPGLLLTLGNSGKLSKLLVAGPRGLLTVYRALTVIAPALPYPVELIELAPRDEFSPWEAMTVRCFALDHGMPCLGYHLEERRPPVFDPQKAAALDIPKPLYRTLHAGQCVTLASGRTVRPEEVLAGTRAPIRLVYATDTRPSEEIVRQARGADLLIVEGMYGDDAQRQQAADRGHMVFREAAQLAARAEVKQMLLTHYSPAMPHPEEHLEAATALFARAALASDGLRLSLRG